MKDYGLKTRQDPTESTGYKGILCVSYFCNQEGRMLNYVGFPCSSHCITLTDSKVNGNYTGDQLTLAKGKGKVAYLTSKLMTDAPCWLEAATEACLPKLLCKSTAGTRKQYPSPRTHFLLRAKGHLWLVEIPSLITISPTSTLC